MGASTAVRFDQPRIAVSSWRYPVKGSTKLYNGTAAMVILGTGYLIPAADTASGVFVGFVNSSAPGGIVDNSGGNDGDLTCEVTPADQTTPEGVQYFETNCSGATQAAWQEQFVYWSDDHTVVLAASSTNKVCAGRVKEVISSTRVRVDAADRSAVATS